MSTSSSPLRSLSSSKESSSPGRASIPSSASFLSTSFNLGRAFFLFFFHILLFIDFTGFLRTFISPRVAPIALQLELVEEKYTLTSGLTFSRVGPEGSAMLTSGTQVMHQPDKEHGRPNSDNFGTTGEKSQEQAGFSRQC